ncbi:MAG: histone deacetylase [Acidobacteriota bacterium]
MKRRGKLPLIYSEKYNLDLGPHIFPSRKYHHLVEMLARDYVCRPEEMLTPAPASDADLLLVHTSEYLHKLKDNSLTPAERWRLEIPYTPQLLDAMRTTVGGTILAARKAREKGLAVHIGGGFHHAFPGHGEGFCLLNDVAVAARKLLHEERVSSVMIIDCDLHQGNGNAMIFRGDSRVFTFSIHQENNFPFEKPPSSMDIGLEDGAGDEEYLAALKVIPSLLDKVRPEIVFYLAGADPYEHDQLGGLSLTMQGFILRDRLVMSEAARRSIPLAALLAGGYARRPSDTVEIHYNMIVEAIAVFDGKR